MPERMPTQAIVSIHNGIHGVGSLEAATFDWRNPVGLVVIKKFVNSS